MRLDAKVVELLKCSKTYAQNLIKNNCVCVNEKIITKNSYEITNETILINDTNQYVSRGAYKLLDAIKNFNINVCNKVCLDIGASTGGFSDVLLQEGALNVYAVDVGTNQLHPKIKNNAKVIQYEHYNFRYADKSDFKLEISFICVDVSFISINLIIDKIIEIANHQTDVVILLKPQFEVGAQHLNKHGIVKNEKVVLKMLEEKKQLFKLKNLKLKNIKKCDLIGKTGNQEYLVHLKVGD